MTTKYLPSKLVRAAGAAALVAASIVPALVPTATHAGQFSQAFVRLDRIKATTTTGGRVCATPASTGTEGKVVVTFPTTGGTDYIVNATAANWTTNTTGLDTGQTAWPSISSAATAVSGKSVTFTSGDLTVGTLYCFNFAAASTLTTSSAGASETTQGTVVSQTSGGAGIDTSTYSESIISDDQVVVNAVVPPSFALVLSGNTDSFSSNLSTASVNSTSGKTITITTNAPSGWVVWAKDLNAASSKGALKSATASNYTIAGVNSAGASSAALTAGTENYGLGVTINTDASGGGTVALDAAYDGTSSKAGTLDPTNYRPVASANGTANGDIINLIMRATIAGQTPAATDYTDTVTYVGAGRF